MRKCDFCNNEAFTTIGTDHTFTMCRDCWNKLEVDLAKKCPKCQCCEDCEELEEVEDDDMF